MPQIPQFNRQTAPLQEEVPDMNLDPVKIQEAAGVVAQAKRAMQYLKDALDVLKTGKNEKKAGEPTAEQIGSAHASAVPPEHGGSGDMSATLAENIPGYTPPPPKEQVTKGAGVMSTEEIFSNPGATRDMGFMDRLKANKERDQAVLDQLGKEISYSR